jgi:hypothetical protein
VVSVEGLVWSAGGLSSIEVKDSELKREDEGDEDEGGAGRAYLLFGGGTEGGGVGLLA